MLGQYFWSYCSKLLPCCMFAKSSHGHLIKDRPGWFVFCRNNKAVWDFTSLIPVRALLTSLKPIQHWRNDCNQLSYNFPSELSFSYEGKPWIAFRDVSKNGANWRLIAHLRLVAFPSFSIISTPFVCHYTTRETQTTASLRKCRKYPENISF